MTRTVAKESRDGCGCVVERGRPAGREGVGQSEIATRVPRPRTRNGLKSSNWGRSATLRRSDCKGVVPRTSEIRPIDGPKANHKCSIESSHDRPACSVNSASRIDASCVAERFIGFFKVIEKAYATRRGKGVRFDLPDRPERADLMLSIVTVRADDGVRPI